MKNKNLKANFQSKMIPRKESSHDYFNKIEEVDEEIYDEAEKDIARF